MKRGFEPTRLVLFIIALLLQGCGADQDAAVDAPSAAPAPVVAAPVYPPEDSAGKEVMEGVIEVPDEESMAEGPPATSAPVGREPASVEVPAEAEGPRGEAGTPSSSPLENYSVVLGASEHLSLPGVAGELRVWIGREGGKPDFHEGMRRDETVIPALGNAAVVEPFAPAFIIEPVKSPCVAIHPSGSDVRFQLTPKKAGEFLVGASVYLYATPDCSGAPIPKTTATLKVLVEVDSKAIMKEKGGELGSVFWQKLVDFWGALVALFFALLLYLIRGTLKKWFGFGGEGKS